MRECTRRGVREVATNDEDPDKPARMWQNTENEILTTERAYVEDLRILIEEILPKTGLIADELQKTAPEDRKSVV